MKIKKSILPIFTLSAGILGMIFRFWLSTAGTDQEGLMIPYHPSFILTFVVAAVTLAVLGLCTWGAGATPSAFPRSIPAAIGAFIAAAGVLGADLIELGSAKDTIAVVSIIAGLAAVWCFVQVGVARLRGKPCHLIAHIVLIVYFMVHLVMQYRSWCTVPQLQHYFFPLLGSVSLLLCVFHRACKDLLRTKERAFLFFNQTALFCCFLSLTDRSWPFYLGLAVWTALDLLPVTTIAGAQKKSKEQ